VPVVAYPYQAAAARAFYATASGLSSAPGAAARALPASRAPNASVLSADGAAIAAAVNGWGLYRITPSPDLSSYRLDGEAMAGSFAGLSTAGAWPFRDGFLVQLYRDPFTEGGAAPKSAARLVFAGAGSPARALDPFATASAQGFELFALLPSGASASAAWLAELRKDGTERVELRFLSLDDPLAPSPQGRELRRADFESSLKPRPLKSLEGKRGDALRACLAALGKGDWLVRLRSGDGSDRWYLDGGPADEAAPAYAWSLGDSALALSAEGGLAFSEGGAAPSLTRLKPPVEGACFTALAATDSLAAAAWETGDFPDLSAAGIVVLGIASPAARDTIGQ